MRIILAVVALALAIALPLPAAAQVPPPGPAVNTGPSSPAPQPAPSSSAAAPARKKDETLLEHVLYRGAFDDESRVPLFSDPDLDLVKHERFAQMRAAGGSGRAVFSIGCRTCTFPLSSDGKRMALGSTCDEKEVVTNG